VVFHAGLWMLGGINRNGIIPDGVSRVPDLVPQSPRGSPLSAIASAGMTGWLKEAFYLERLCRRLCLRKGRVRVCSRKMGRQGVKSASPTREARPLTPQLAQEELSGGSNASEAKLRAVPSQENGSCASAQVTSKTLPRRPEMRVLPRRSNDCRAPADRWHCRVQQPRPLGRHCRGPDRH